MGRVFCSCILVKAACIFPFPVQKTFVAQAAVRSHLYGSVGQGRPLLARRLMQVFERSVFVSPTSRAHSPPFYDLPPGSFVPLAPRISS